MSYQKDVLRTTGKLAVKTSALLQIGVGTLANIILFFYNVSPILLGHRQRPTHVVLTHMAVANLLALLSSAIPHTTAAFVLRSPLSSVGCKFSYYIYRVARNTTMCSTCVLSTYQFFTLIPGRVEWTMLRGRTPKVIGPFCCTCWMISFLTNVFIPVKVAGPQDMENDTDVQGKWFCPSSNFTSRMVILLSISDVMFIFLMVWSGGSIVLLLHRHHQRVQHIHTPNGYHKCPPETRAAHTILMLVVTFVIPYMLNSILAFYITAFLDARPWLMHISHILALCFPTFSPLLLILRDPRAPSFCS
ncbi:vomeronasal type-1 receptor 1-like [Diceros bicornis minor]|uniref:vomeronasal type-1 receptor 1-like n=1 Tax=Diceros bicornis minor TaxID=77932 RepID=UPI0026EEFAB6|nr:vomeronasal type-1 receptor 1-like [Diceros bicornis minor]